MKFVKLVSGFYTNENLSSSSLNSPGIEHTNKTHIIPSD